MNFINSLPELRVNLKYHERVALLLFHSEKESSACALNNIEKAGELNKSHRVLVSDVTKTRDIHRVYEITSTPSLLLFINGELINVIKGCHDNSVLDALIKENQPPIRDESPKEKRVIVYSTPTCSWCNTLKSWLSKNNIRFTDIDVSRDEKAAVELVRRTGQQGVPQTDINGQFVVGFDQKRLKELLEIQ